MYTWNVYFDDYADIDDNLQFFMVQYMCGQQLIWLLIVIIQNFDGYLQYIGYCTCDEESILLFCNKHFCVDCIGQMDTYHFDSVSCAKCNFVFCI